MGLSFLMEFDLDENLSLGHLLLSDRQCRTCRQTKNLVDGFYRTRKDRGPVESSYSYECKKCTIERVKNKKRATSERWQYPDW